MTARDTIIEMLRRYNDAREPLGNATDVPGDGNVTGMRLMPRTWNESYRKLEACLHRMRDERPSQYAHVCARYINPESVVVDVGVKKTPRGPVFKLPPHCELRAGQPVVGASKVSVRVSRWPAWVRAIKVEHGIDYLTETFPGTPYLPLEFTNLRTAA